MTIETIFQEIIEFWPKLTAFVIVLISLIASIHAVMNKNEPSAAVGWSALIWLSPVFGAVLYWIFGINRIKRKAYALKRRRYPGLRRRRKTVADPDTPEFLIPPSRLLETKHPTLAQMVTYGQRAHGLPLRDGNAVTQFCNGDEAYPQMLNAIDHATESVCLSSYIFDNDDLGKRFATHLYRAQQRGVAVRVLIDATGSRYSFPSIVGHLRARGLRVATFLPNFLPWHMVYINLRNHKKLLIVDGELAFTGGMNLRIGNLVEQTPTAKAIADVHFRIEGPIVTDLAAVFVEDWDFATRERLPRDLWQKELSPKGHVTCRALPDGPDIDFERIYGTVLCAIRAARRRIRIVTPYFLPDATIVNALSTAALSGVDVEILIPAKNNLRFVGWACDATIPDLVQDGCRVYRTAPPFDHSKIMLIDQEWSMIGTANWDARSFRLNFEFNLECFDAGLNQSLNQLFEEKRASSTEVLFESLRRQSFVHKFRNRFARVATPYL